MEQNIWGKAPQTTKEPNGLNGPLGRRGILRMPNCIEEYVAHCAEDIRSAYDNSLKIPGESWHALADMQTVFEELFEEYKQFIFMVMMSRERKGENENDNAN